MGPYKFCPKKVGFMKHREDYAIYIFAPNNRLISLTPLETALILMHPIYSIRLFCAFITKRQSFDYGVLLLIAINCITLAMERPGIPKTSNVSYDITSYSHYLPQPLITSHHLPSPPTTSHHLPPLI